MYEENPENRKEKVMPNADMEMVCYRLRKMPRFQRFRNKYAQR